MSKFEIGLLKLLKECGLLLDSPITITPDCPSSSRFIDANGRIGEGMYAAVRQEQPLTLTITVTVIDSGKWHHSSGDDRRLHPSFNSGADLLVHTCGRRLGE